MHKTLLFVVEDWSTDWKSLQFASSWEENIFTVDPYWQLSTEKSYIEQNIYIIIYFSLTWNGAKTFRPSLMAIFCSSYISNYKTFHSKTVTITFCNRTVYWIKHKFLYIYEHIIKIQSLHETNKMNIIRWNRHNKKFIEIIVQGFHIEIN